MSLPPEPCRGDEHCPARVACKAGHGYAVCDPVVLARVARIFRRALARNGISLQELSSGDESPNSPPER